LPEIVAFLQTALQLCSFAALHEINMKLQVNADDQATLRILSSDRGFMLVSS
jgi:hypothetical protein